MTTRPFFEILNVDVLLHVFSFLARRDLSLLMKTSHDCYELGLRQLFCGPIQLRADNIISFHSCLRLGASPSRPSFLRHVIVTSSITDKAVSAEDLLRDILQDACHLKRLQLDWGAASSSSYLRYAAIGATSLEELTAPFVSQTLCDAITALAAPLRRLTMRFGPMNRFPAADPVSLLEPFCSTLEELDLSVVHCEEATVEYPLVSKLTLSDCYYGLLRGGIDIAPVTRAFPNVFDLTLSAAKVHPEVSHWENGRSCDHAELIERCRQSNRRHWLRGGDMWQLLTHVTVGHVVDLYMLGLCQIVPCVSIQMLSAGTMWILPCVLADMRPSSLAISLFARDHTLDALRRLLPPGDGTVFLTQILLELHCDVPGVNIDKLITSTTALLASLRVEHLRIALARWDTAGPYRLSRDDTCAIECALDHIHDDCERIATRILEAIPSLRELILAVGGREARFGSTRARE
ncbi:hypothetical protein C8Q74DRAFT_1318768 [Fomes fomentarius]|nr:hypothetical protein C8Q74DRAFT_1318768 [Fomes fomentarius]